MSSTEAPQEPIALVVDDNPIVLEARLQYFRRKGFRALGAATKADALRQVKNTPALDIVVTDLDLSGGKSRPTNEGEDLAKEIREFRSDLPIVAYTAHQEPDYLKSVNWKVFTKTISKVGAGEDIEKHLHICRDLALEHKRRRIEIAKSELLRLQKKYDIADYDVATLRAFLPGLVSQSAGTESDGDPQSADDVLRDAGYHLHLIEAGTNLGSVSK